MVSPRRAPRVLRHLGIPSLLLAAGAQLGCPSATETPRGVATVTPPPAKPSAPPPEFPARWVLHPSRSLKLRGRWDLGKDGMIYVGAGGERWLDKRNGQAPVAAPTLLPQSLRGVLAGADGALLFVAQSGTVFVAGKDPLGPPAATREAPKGMRSVSVGRAAIIAIADGGLRRSTDGGASWVNVSLPAGATSRGVLTHVALASNGDGLALFAPQHVLVTNDDGATWKEIATPGLGARRVVTDTNGDVVLEGLEASAVLRPGPRFERANRSPSTEYELPIPTDEGALGYAEAFAEGRAVIEGTHYAEVLNDPDDSTRWRLAIGEMGGKPAVRRLPELDACDGAMVARRGKSVVVGCQRSPSVSYNKYRYGGGSDHYQLHMFRSEDEGKTFKADGQLTIADRRKRMWILEGGAILIEGGCKPTHGGNDWSCEESPPVIRLPGAKGFAKIGVNTAGVQFYDLAVSPNGQRVYAVGQTSSGRVALFASSDGGKDFTRHMLPPVPGDDPKSEPLLADTFGLTVSVDDAGSTAVLASAGRRWLSFTASDDAVTLKGKVLPFEATSAALAGKRGLAYDTNGAAYETMDGGAVWTKVAAPQLGVGEDTTVQCGDYGCLLGSRATRVGWDLKTAADVKPYEEKAAGKKTVAGTPIKCATAGSWVSFGATARPTIFEADFNPTQRWYTLSRDVVKGNVAAVVPTFEGKPDPKDPKADTRKLEAKELAVLAPPGKDVATYAMTQNGAVASLKYAFKRDTPSKPGAYSPVTPKQSVDIEVAWWHAATGKIVRGTIKGAGPLDPSRDMVERRDQPSDARVALMTIGPGGVLVRPFASASADSVAYFVGADGKVDKLAWPELPTRDARGASLWLRYETARIGKRTLLYGMSTSHAQVLMAWANEAGTNWETRTWGLWPEIEGAPNDATVRLLHGAATPTLAVFAGNGSGGLGPMGWATPLAAGEPDPTSSFALPTQRSLGDGRACDKAGLAAPRVVAPYSRGTRHPVIVDLDGAEVLLATNQATVHVPPGGGDGCLGMWEATPPVWKSGDQFNALVPLDDLAHVVLFRSTSKSNEQQARVLTCTLSKETPIPASLNNVDGFVE
jgi:photosystem II stability/assembly factor-like uncharacterized protein